MCFLHSKLIKVVSYIDLSISTHVSSLFAVESSGKSLCGDEESTCRVVIHVDMDCFFVSVLMRDR